MMRLTSVEVTTRLKDILMKDFSEALSSQIIKQNYHKHWTDPLTLDTKLKKVRIMTSGKSHKGHSGVR